MKTVQQSRSRSLPFVVAALAATACIPLPAQRPPCTGHHPGRQHRVESVLKKGDSFMTQSVAGHVTKFAFEHYQLEGLVTDADVARAFDSKTRRGEMVNFLEFKFGSPSAAMTEFVANGYQHFDRGYADEAAAIMLGLIRFGRHTPDFVLPDWLAAQVKAEVKEQTKEAISGFLQSKGVPALIADQIGAKIASKVAERVPVAISFPKQFDVDNRLIELAIEAKRKSLAQDRGKDQGGPSVPKPQLPAPAPRKFPGATRKE
jgi:hypothetical protein